VDLAGISFLLFLRSGIALSTRGGGADWNEGTVGGIPSKEDPNAPWPRSGFPVGGAARESKTAPEKGTFRLGGMPAITRTPPNRERPA